MPIFVHHKNTSDLFRTRIFEKNTAVMNAKLTLTVDKSVVEKAKIYARNTGRSLSEIVEIYLEAITRENAGTPISPKLQRLLGAVNLPDGFDEKAALDAIMSKRHL